MTTQDIIKIYAEQSGVFSHSDMLQKGADGNLTEAILTNFPISLIDGREPVPANVDDPEGNYHPGREITAPVEIAYDGNSYILYSGNHRLAQAEANGQSQILAFVGTTMQDREIIQFLQTKFGYYFYGDYLKPKNPKAVFEDKTQYPYSSNGPRYVGRR